MDEIWDKIKELEDKIDNKIDCDVFDNEIVLLRNMIADMSQDEKSRKIDIKKPV